METTDLRPFYRTEYFRGYHSQATSVQTFEQKFRKDLHSRERESQTQKFLPRLQTINASAKPVATGWPSELGMQPCQLVAPNEECAEPGNWS
ncbi:hypothetical protein RRG08_055681 [Elysia crispata]|uniref:Uncharacterized protein n=1 Tax=Elysia crispata TaxID=231223 RepID=A0AAE0ZBR3_9GAST|nr:hypothetical protein RRG08_055681 [Elysia crispata]